MRNESDDYTSDMEFGKWLRDQRVNAGLSLEQGAAKSGLSAERLKSLELGLSERGVTKTESEKLCSAYNLVLKDFLQRASGGPVR